MFDTYAEIFEQRAKEYHAAMRNSPRARDAEFLAAVEPFREVPAGLLCDMPSGGGYLADYLWPGMEYLAVDPATDFFIEWPRTLPRVLSEITAVPRADQSVDYVVSLAGLHHEPSLPRVFEEMRRLVRPGGRVVIADVAVDTPPARFLNGFVDENCPLGHEGKFLDEHSAPALEAAGFTILEDQLVEVPWAFDDLNEAGEFCRFLFGMVALPAEAVSDALERDIGFDTANGGPRLKWALRRLVAEAA